MKSKINAKEEKSMELRKKHNIIMFIVWIVGIVAIFISTAAGWYRPLPKVQVEECVDFDGEAAYDYVNHIATNYPYRIYGSSVVDELGDNIADFFGKLGLEVIKQEFVSWRPDADKFYLKFDIVDNDVNLFSDSYDTLIENVNGTNIIGISRGESKETILIGAHRDMANGTQGAEDNASGTGVLMELAKELSANKHFYTYLFVSFDGEEAQEKGSDYFVNHYQNIDDVKLAIILDQVGFSEADSLMTYGKYGGFEQLSLGTQSLLKSCLDVTGKANVSFDPNYAPNRGVESLVKHIVGKGFGSMNTDCNPFYHKHIPAFGIKAINAEKMIEAVVHCAEDNMEQISSKTLKMTGNFVKTMVATLEAEHTIFDTLSVQDDFVISGEKFLPTSNMYVAKVILMVLIGLGILDKIFYMVKYVKKEDNVRYLVSCGLSLIWACALCFLLRYGLVGFFKDVSILVVLFIWVILLIVGILFIKKIILRNCVDNCNTIYFQQILNGMVFGILVFGGNTEYAVVLFSVAMIGTVIMKMLGERFSKIGIIIKGLYIVFHSFIMLAVFNVFLRGVNLERFLVVQIMSLFIFITMNVFVFGKKCKQ